MFDLPFQWSVRAMQALLQSGWKPAGSQEQASFVKLAALFENGPLLDPTEPLDLFPWVKALSTAHLAAGIASVSFAPDRPTLALGTEQGQVILWNYLWSAPNISALKPCRPCPVPSMFSQTYGMTTATFVWAHTQARSPGLYR
jgi:hypothetical protein